MLPKSKTVMFPKKKDDVTHIRLLMLPDWDWSHYRRGRLVMLLKCRTSDVTEVLETVTLPKSKTGDFICKTDFIEE